MERLETRCKQLLDHLKEMRRILKTERGSNRIILSRELAFAEPKYGPVI